MHVYGGMIMLLKVFTRVILIVITVMLMNLIIGQLGIVLLDT